MKEPEIKIKERHVHKILAAVREMKIQSGDLRSRLYRLEKGMTQVEMSCRYTLQSQRNKKD